ncbi:MAG: metallophosphoesterase [Gemmatimonadetes bacterium]|nr:metallophosphoesterase [Gemmatimonadota bacterium]
MFIAGNHDFAFERQAAVAEALVPPEVTYLRDQAVSLDGLTVWGAPWQPLVHGLGVQPGAWAGARGRMGRIPDDVDVLLTHGPPHGILDQTSARPPERVGCADLRRRIASLSRLRLHTFGHIHEAYGIERHGDVTFVNASTCDLRYEPRNAPVVVEV